MRFIVSLEGSIDVTSDGDAPVTDQDRRTAIESHLDNVMDELMTLAAEDPTIDVNVETGHVSLAVVVEARNPIGATAQASGLFRTAIHAAGGHTPDWPNEDRASWGIRLMDLRATPVNASDNEDYDQQKLVGA